MENILKTFRFKIQPDKRFWNRYGRSFHVDVQLTQEQFEDHRIQKAAVQHEVRKRAPAINLNGFLWTEDPPVPSSLIDRIRRSANLPAFAEIAVYYPRSNTDRRKPALEIDDQTFQYVKHVDPRFVSVTPVLNA